MDGSEGLRMMRQFDIEAANKNFRKDRAKFLDKQIKEKMRQRHLLDIEISILVDKREKLNSRKEVNNDRLQTVYHPA